MNIVAEPPAQSAARINPVVTEIIRNGLIAVTEEMKINLMRAGGNFFFCS